MLLGWAGSAFPFTPERLLNLRIPGVLPRIGVVYILGTWLVLLVDEENPAVRGLVSRLGAAILALLALHTFLLLGLGYDLTRLGNIQRAVDLALLRGHLWKKDWDPEGIVSTLTAVATFLTGSVAGICVLAKRPLRERAGILAVWGAVGAALGLLLHPLLPINKNLWTASYVVFTSGAASLCLGALLGTMKEEPKSRLTAHVRGFFATFGTNPLLAFLGSGLLARCLGLVKWTTAAGPVSLQAFLYKNGLGWLPDPYLASHAWAALNVLVWWGILRALEKRGVFWKV